VGRTRSTTRWVVPSLASVFLSACGLAVPEIQELPSDKTGGQQLVQSIVYNVTCEVQDAVYAIYQNVDHPIKHSYLDTWGVQIALSLQIEEKSSLNPIVSWLPPSPVTSVFSAGVAGTLSSDAIRQDKLNSYFTIDQIKRLGRCDVGTRPSGVLLLQSNLALDEWLQDNLTAGNTGEIHLIADKADGPLKQNVLSHEVKFDITDTGSLTPGLKLTRVSINQSGNFASVTRDRTNDVTITLGPATVKSSEPVLDKTGKPKMDKTGLPLRKIKYGPSEDAANAAISSQIGLAVSNALRGALLP
jgi:hypothetical protein